MMRPGLALAALCLAALALPFVVPVPQGGPSAPVASTGGDGFDHAQHAGLFPVCSGCHAGVEREGTALYPTPQQCAACHDGQRQPTVDWVPPTPAAGRLAFDHVEHASALTAAGDTPMECQGCHATAGATRRMEVAAATADDCAACHFDEAGGHLASLGECQQCHLPITQATGLALAEVSAQPAPPTHEADDFLSTHGDLARAFTAACATCHARADCEVCHYNAGSLAVIGSLGEDERVSQLAARRAPSWPRPGSHDEAGFARSGHAALARAELASCGNCHVQAQCRDCHTSSGEAGRLVAQLPAGDDRPGEGRPRWHPAGYAQLHGPDARTDLASCQSCHSDQSCRDCHAPSGDGSFHGTDFVARHGREAWSQGDDCSRCHSTEGFCRDCHAGQGLAQASRGGFGYHDASPIWLLQHGAAARRAMDSCASCHAQPDCLRCHSQGGGWGVNPHGPGFDARAQHAANAATCRLCHLVDPLR